MGGSYKKPSRRELVVAWLIWASFTSLGIFVVGPRFEHWLEPSAVRLLYSRVPTPSEDVPLRVIDIGPMYDRQAIENVDATPAPRMQLLFRALSEAFKGRPDAVSAVGVDIDLAQRKSAAGTFQHEPASHREILLAALRFASDTSTPVYIGVGRNEVSPQNAFASDVVSDSADLAAYTITFKGDMTVMPREFRVPSGKVLPDGTKEVETRWTLGARLAASRAAFAPLQSVSRDRLPRDWPEEVEAFPVFVNHALLRKEIREKITLSVNRYEARPWETWQDVFPEETLRALQNLPEKTMILVGSTQVFASKDIMAFDEEGGWLVSSEPLRGVYGHASLAYTLSTAALRRVPHKWNIGLDVGFSVLGLLLTLGNMYRFHSARLRANKRANTITHGALAILLLALVLAVVPLALAEFGYLWIGFLATAGYVLVERPASALVYAVLGLEH